MDGRSLSRLIALGCLITLAACGSSRPGGSGPRAAGDPLLALAQCMRAHGVPNFPDPGAHGLAIPNDINPQSPAFESAQRACRTVRNQPGSSGGGQRAASASQRLRMVALAKCLRGHGFPGVGDPTATPPTAPPPGTRTGNVIGIGGVYLRLPPDSQGLHRASAACGGP